MTRIISPVGIPEYDWLTTVKLDDFARAEVRATAPSSSGVIESNVNPLAPEPKNSTDWGETPGMYLPRFWYVLDDGPFVSMVDVMVKLPCSSVLKSGGIGRSSKTFQPAEEDAAPGPMNPAICSARAYASGLFGVNQIRTRAFGFPSSSARKIFPSTLRHPDCFSSCPTYSLRAPAFCSSESTRSPLAFLILVSTAPILASAHNSPATPVTTSPVPSSSSSNLIRLGLYGGWTNPRPQSCSSSRYSQIMKITSNDTPMTTSHVKTVN